MKNQPLVLFDGPCSLCQRSVRFILRHERKPAVLHFASLQSETGKEALNQFSIPEETDAMVFIEHENVWTGSQASLTLCGYLSYPWRIFYPCRHLPAFLHQPIYNLIARHRYRWFGKDETCPLPAPDQAERFLS